MVKSKKSSSRGENKDKDNHSETSRKGKDAGSKDKIKVHADKNVEQDNREGRQRETAEIMKDRAEASEISFGSHITNAKKKELELEKQKLSETEKKHQSLREKELNDVVSYGMVEEKKRNDELENTLRLLNKQAEFRQNQRYKEIQMEKEARRDQIADRQREADLNLDRYKKRMDTIMKLAVVDSEVLQNWIDELGRKAMKQGEHERTKNSPKDDNGEEDKEKKEEVEEKSEHDKNQNSIKEQDKQATDKSGNLEEKMQNSKSSNNDTNPKKSEKYKGNVLK